MDRANNMDLDVGFGPMEAEWDECISESIKEQLDESFTAVFGSKSLVSRKSNKRLALAVELDPYLSGYWGEDTVMTLSHQSILLGAPSFQLEIPYSLRKLLMEDEEFFTKFSTALYEVYDLILKTDFSKITSQMHRDRTLQDLYVMPSIDTEIMKRILHDLRAVDTTKHHGKSI